jgi:hypothetical protein
VQVRKDLRRSKNALMTVDTFDQQKNSTVISIDL